MKKIFALIITMAMVMSLFSGVVLAAPDAVYVVTVSPTSIIAGKATDIGVTVKVDDAVTSDALIYTVSSGGTVVSSGYASSGSFTIAGLNVPIQAGNATAYSVEVKNINGDKITKTAATLTAKYDMQLNAYGDVYKGDVKTFVGKLLKGDGKVLDTMPTITLKNSSGAVVATATTANDGSFVFAYKFDSADLYKIHVGSDPYVSIGVKAKSDLKVTVQAGSPTISLDASKLSIKVTDSASTPNLLENAKVKVTGPVEKEGYTDNNGVVQFQYDSGDATKPWLAGTYTITANYTKDLKDGITPTNSTTTYFDYTGSTTYTVNLPGKLNFSASVDSTAFTGTATNVNVTLKNAAGNGVNKGAAPAVTDITKFEYTITGPIAASKTVKSDSVDDGKKDIVTAVVLEQAGNLVVKGTVTFGDGSTQSFEKSIEIKGQNVTTQKVLGAVDDEVALTATVTTTDSTPVNNAVVTWKAYNKDALGNLTEAAVFAEKNTDGTFKSAVAEVKVSANDYNINGGVYTSKTYKLTNVANYVEIKVVPLSDSQATKALFVGSVDGKNVYTVTVDKAALVAGMSQEIVISVTNADGKVIKPTSGSLKSSLSTPGFDEIKFENLADSAWIDTNADGTKDSFKVTVLPKKAETFTVTAKTDAGKFVGKANVVVNAPAVTITPEDKVVTDSVTETVTISYNDGVTAGAYLRVTALGLDFSDAKKPVVKVGTNTLSANNDKQYTFDLGTTHTFTVKATDDAAIANTTTAPELKIEVAYAKDSQNAPVYVEVARLAVKPLVVTTDKTEVAIGGAARIVATVTDAHGNVMAEQTVKAEGIAAASGTTDANGKVTLTVTPSSTGNITVSVDGVATAKAVVKAVSDTTAPEITLEAVPATVKTNTITIKGSATDDVKVTNIFVNGQPVLVVPNATVNFRAKVELELGVNEIEIFAFDAAGNAVQEVVEVEYVAPTVVKMTLGTTDVTKDGQALTGLDVPAQSIGGRTMLPLRFAFETLLGGTVDYNNGVITVYYNGKTAVMTVGSTTAMVDGQAMTLLSAPVVQNNRALAPIREVLQAFGVTVGFDSATNSVSLTY